MDDTPIHQYSEDMQLLVIYAVKQEVNVLEAVVIK